MALLQGDLKTAADTIEEYGQQVDIKQVPFEMRQYHEVVGMLALHQGDYDGALAELERANQQNPKVLYLQAVACEGKGDAAGTREFCTKAANFNGLNINYAYVKAKAEALLGSIGAKEGE